MLLVFSRPLVIATEFSWNTFNWTYCYGDARDITYMTAIYTVISDSLFHGSSTKIFWDQVLSNFERHTAVWPFLKVFSKDDDLPNDHAPAWRWIVHSRYTSQRWAGWGATVIPAWEGYPWLPDLLHSCPLAFQKEVAYGTSLRAVGARDCASDDGDFQEQDDFPAIRTATTMRAIHPVYISWLLRAVKHSSNPWMRERDGLLGTHKKPSLYHSVEACSRAEAEHRCCSLLDRACGSTIWERRWGKWKNTSDLDMREAFLPWLTSFLSTKRLWFPLKKTVTHSLYWYHLTPNTFSLLILKTSPRWFIKGYFSLESPRL